MKNNENKNYMHLITYQYIKIMPIRWRHIAKNTRQQKSNILENKL